MRAGLFLATFLALFWGGADAPARAQQLGVVQSDVLVIDIERLLEETAYGQKLQAGIEAERDALIARNDRVAAELEAEEQKLTELRATTPPDEFREMADAFDTKVTQLRRESERLSRELERQRDLAPVQFMRVVQPVLGEILNEADAVALLDVRSVILRAEVADVTDIAVSRIDARIGEGPEPSDAPQE
ncbi:OmpH family outer membrane protein [Roseovarius nitratireducens]|uniref:OmpH family outer membrane protein n=1 Tax=Roseovarius nitratireducens TaxID=2044597 RepID=UPI000CE1A153|nr:OmpH family outer membrane protein [Roseovarius nitratireducens]